MTGGGQKAGLRQVRIFGDGFGFRQLAVQAHQFLGAFAHALLQRLVGGLQRLLRLHRLRHVRIGGDEPAVRHGRGAYFNHRAGGEPQP